MNKEYPTTCDYCNSTDVFHISKYEAECRNCFRKIPKMIKGLEKGE